MNTMAPVADSSSYPYPPIELATRVFRLDSWSDPLAAYEHIGRQTKDAVVDLLPDGWSFEGKRVLDFGSGAGRTLRHFLTEAEAGAEFWGADMDEPSISWLRDTLCPPLHAWKCAEGPPLGLELGSFDLIYAISVFSHLTDSSIPWLLELHRLLKRDGLLIATYIGRWVYESMTGEPWDEDRVGMKTMHHHNDWDFGGPTALMSDWWVRAHWGRAFEILDVRPQVHDQTWVLMRKRDVALTTEDLERPADDPREYAAVVDNLRQVNHHFAQWLQGSLRRVEELQAERDLLRRTLDAERELLRRDYESSLSWRITAPLRAAARIARARRGEHSTE